jgi:hypothetical protein
MRARLFVLALICGTATAALAQTSGYVRFAAPDAQSCALACGGDQMCASWTYGSSARAYGQGGASGMCTFTTSSSPLVAPGLVSGLPRRSATPIPAPVVAPPARQSPAASGGGNQVRPMAPQGGPASRGASGWDVRPAPWLNHTQAQPQAQVQPQQFPNAPAMLGQPASPPLPSPVPFAAPRIDFEPQRAPLPSQVGGPIVLTQPTAPPPRPQVQAPSYAPPVMMTPPPPSGTQMLPQQGDGAVSVPMPVRPRAGSGVPRQPQAGLVPGGRSADTEGPPQVAPVTVAPPRRSSGRGTPRAKSSSIAPQTSSAPVVEANAPQIAPAASNLAAPPRQTTQTRPGAPASPARQAVRDPFNPESFRGPDGMIDAAEMRRAQVEAARTQGGQAYSVQREWEAVATEQRRAEEAGEVRVDPLAGTVPVPPPPETAAQRRAREAEEAEIAAEERRASGQSEVDERPVAQPTRTRPRGARGTPRTRAPAPTIDREPRLAGGPG